jgi:hypothetical protein
MLYVCIYNSSHWLLKNESRLIHFQMAKAMLCSYRSDGLHPSDVHPGPEIEFLFVCIELSAIFRKSKPRTMFSFLVQNLWRPY